MLREVIEEPNFLEQFDSLRDEHPEIDMDAVHADITWTLASNPRIGELIEVMLDPTYRVYKTKPIDDLPSFRVLYRYTDKHVILLSIII